MASSIMIRSWKDASTRRFVETGKSRWRGMDVEVAKERLQARKLGRDDQWALAPRISLQGW
jgi:hypothetical protein